MLDFTADKGIGAEVEAFEKTISGEVRFRLVIDIDTLRASS